MEPKGKPPRLAEIFQSYRPPVFFVTFGTRDRKALLANHGVHSAFVRYATRGLQEKYVAVGRYVILPDHVHLFVCGTDNFDLGIWVRGLKRALASGVEAAVPGGKSPDGPKPLGTAATTPVHTQSIWQPGFFDHLLRSDESYEQKWHYVQENPVRAGLVKQAADWPYQGEIAVIDRL